MCWRTGAYHSARNEDSELSCPDAMYGGGEVEVVYILGNLSVCRDHRCWLERIVKARCGRATDKTCTALRSRKPPKVIKHCWQAKWQVNYLYVPNVSDESRCLHRPTRRASGPLKRTSLRSATFASVSSSRTWVAIEMYPTTPRLHSSLFSAQSQLLTFILRFIFRRPLIPSFGPFFLQIFTFVISFAIYSHFANIATPKRDVKGAVVSGGEDLSGGGLIEWGWDT